MKALHASDKSEAWKECNGLVGSELKNQKSASSVTLLPRLLERLEILFFNGDRDWICNYVGVQRAASQREALVQLSFTTMAGAMTCVRCSRATMLEFL